MSFENKSTDELIRIAKAGLGFTLNKNNISAQDLHQVIIAATQSGAHITVVDTNTSRPIEIAAVFEKLANLPV